MFCNHIPVLLYFQGLLNSFCSLSNGFGDNCLTFVNMLFFLIHQVCAKWHSCHDKKQEVVYGNFCRMPLETCDLNSLHCFCLGGIFLRPFISSQDCLFSPIHHPQKLCSGFGHSVSIFNGRIYIIYLRYISCLKTPQISYSCV